MLLDYQYMGEIPWNNMYQKENSVILQGKKSRHLVEIMVALALNGPSTTRQMAKFTLENLPNYKYKYVRSKESSNLEKMYNRLLTGTERKKTGRRKFDERYPWLIEEKYVLKTEIIRNQKNNDVQTYFLTLKGCFFALGFTFNNKETLQFLENAARNHLYFSYINKIAKNTSHAFVHEIFFMPIHNMIKKDRLSLNDDISFYFSNFVESHSNAVHKIIERVFKYIDHNQNFYENRMGKRIEFLRKCTFYEENSTTNLEEFMKENLYKNSENIDYFEEFEDKSYEFNFLFRTMKAIHFGIFGAFGFGIPKRTQRIPTSKRWKEYQKYYPKYKSPRDRDKKKGIVLRS